MTSTISFLFVQMCLFIYIYIYGICLSVCVYEWVARRFVSFAAKKENHVHSIFLLRWCSFVLLIFHVLFFVCYDLSFRCSLCCTSKHMLAEKGRGREEERDRENHGATHILSMNFSFNSANSLFMMEYFSYFYFSVLFFPFSHMSFCVVLHLSYSIQYWKIQ